MLLETRDATCPLCGGRGWVIESDGGAGKARPCSCREKDRVRRLLDAAGIPPRYRHCRISKFDVSHRSPDVAGTLQKARAATQAYVDDFVLQEDEGFRRSGLIFVGPPGSGKTHLAVAALIDVIERYRVRGRFAEFTSLISQIQSTFDPNSSESQRAILDPLLKAELLVLDELGSQQPTPWVRDILYLIINHRYTHQQPTLFTTNYLLAPPTIEKLMKSPQPLRQPKLLSLDRGADPEPAQDDITKQLASRLPSMLVSRLYEMGEIVDMTAVPDFRRDIGSHKIVSQRKTRS